LIDELKDVAVGFRDYLADRGFVYDDATRLDMLAAVLGSQLVFFVGPSGTGKSTAAGVLSQFFAPDSERASVDVRPGWSSTEDLLGQYSGFTKAYLKGAATDQIVSVHGATSTPFFTLEEANLSAIESYAGPLVTATSSTRFEQVRWDFHSQPGFSDVPEVVVTEKYPRFLATINVDSTAPAPAPKISGRACVVLLEPPTVEDSLLSVGAIAGAGQAVAAGQGANLIGDPHLAWDAIVVAGRQDDFTNALRTCMDALTASTGGQNVVSPRDVQRCVLYMAWHQALQQPQSGDALTSSLLLSAENAVLHYILPGMSAERFGRAVPGLTEKATDGGLLAIRLARLVSPDDGVFGVPPDFWASLS
jgi:energy-coupling factor transporter ATP-binding protein EcfA2